MSMGWVTRDRWILIGTLETATGFSLLRLVLLVLLFAHVMMLYCPNIVKATIGSWTSNGPVGGSICRLAIDQDHPNTIYASTLTSGVFKSTNGGASWEAVNDGLSHLGVQAITIDPGNSSTLYAGTNGGGVFKSTNGGTSWNAINSGLTYPYVQALAIDPKNPNTIFAYAGSMFKSIDGGNNWINVSNGFTWCCIASIVIDTNNSNVIYIGTFKGIFKSINGGDNWTFIEMADTFVQVIAIDKANSNIVYAGTDDGVFKSTNGGDDWDSAGLKDISILDLEINPTDCNTVYAVVNIGYPLNTYTSAVFKSPNGGIDWSATSLTETYVYDLAVHPTDSNTVYAGSRGGGVMKSTDAGGSWSAANSDLTATFVTAVTVDPNDPNMVYAGSIAGMFKSTDKGTTWSAINFSNPFVSFNALSIDPNNSNIVYAGTSMGVVKSIDKGASWNAIGLTYYQVKAIVIDRNNSNIVYAATNGGGVWTSTNGGTSWNAINTGILYTNIESLAIDPNDSNTLYAGTGPSVLYKTTNRGAGWEATNFACGSILSLAVDPSNSNIVYAGTHGCGVFKSTNGGANWSVTALKNFHVFSLFIDPSNSNTIFAGTSGFGVFKSPNGGADWSALNTGLTDVSVIALTTDATGMDVYAGTECGGVFRWSSIDSVAPRTPTGLTAMAVSSSQIVLGWTDTSDNETGFKIERKTGTCASTNAWTQIGVKMANVTTHINNGLKANRTYAYRIRAYDDTANSEYSPCVSAKTGLFGTPSAPSGLTATAASANKISLQWTDNANNETGFKIFRKRDSEPWTLLHTMGANVRKYDDTAALGNDATSSFRYYVSACNAAGCSPATGTAIVPFKPTAIKATSSAGKINLKWNEKNNNETGFQVYRKAGTCAATNPWELIATTAANVHTHADTDVTAGTPYSYKVRTFVQSAALPHAAGFSLYTGCVSAAASQGTYSLSDLVGAWQLSGLGSISDTPFWRRADLSVEPSGNFAISQTYSDGTTRNDSGILSIAEDGMITIEGLPNMSASLDAGKSLLGFTDTWSDGGIEMGVLTKSSGFYSMADLVGTWRAYGFASGPDAPWWEIAAGSIEEDGTFTGTTTDSEGETGEKTGVFSISSDGKVSFQGNAIAEGRMDAGKTVVVWTDTWTGHGGTTEMKIFTKIAKSYSMTDLAGVWQGSSLVLGGEAPLWERAASTIGLDGNCTSILVKSDGSDESWSGRMAISQDGKITSPDDPEVRGSMDAGKTVMVLISPRGDGTAFYVYTKMLP